MSKFDTYEEKLSFIIDYMESISPDRIEDSYQDEERVHNLKKILAAELRAIEEKTGDSISDNTILIVSHGYTLRHFTGDGIIDNGKSTLCCKNQYDFKNAEIIEFDFSY
jgi:broad specificity phosphatase PhoE